MAIERICIVGAGAIGSLYAGHLAQVASVSVLTRRPEHAAALGRGLRVSGKSELTAELSASHDPDELGDADLVIVACKAGDLPGTAERLRGR